MDVDAEKNSTGLERRTLMKAAAWSVPVLAVGSAAPAMAATPTIIGLAGEGCKIPGNSGPIPKAYVFGATVNSSFSTDIVLNDVQFDIRNSSCAGQPATGGCAWQQFFLAVIFRIDGVDTCTLLYPTNANNGGLGDYVIPCFPTTSFNVPAGANWTIAIGIVGPDASFNAELRITYNFYNPDTMMTEEQTVLGILSGDSWAGNTACRPFDSWPVNGACDDMGDLLELPPGGCPEPTTTELLAPLTTP